MADDPTTKQCPNDCDSGVVYGAYKCDDCGGTGRVPMTTDELLEALRSFGAAGIEISWGDYGHKGCVRVLCWDEEGEEFISRGDAAIASTPAEALRAALDIVTAC